MPHPALLRIAETEVERALSQLPPTIQEAASECTLQYEDFADAIQSDEDLDEDVLGLFEGNNRLDPLPDGPDEMPRIRLFLDSLSRLGGRRDRSLWLRIKQLVSSPP